MAGICIPRFAVGLLQFPISMEELSLHDRQTRLGAREVSQSEKYCWTESNSLIGSEANSPVMGRPVSFGFWTEGRIDVTVSPGGTIASVSPVREVKNAIPFLILGSGSSCDVVIDSPSIPPKAFCVCLDAENRLWGAMLIRHSSKSKSGFRRIDTNKGITIGEFRVEFSIVDATNDAYIRPDDHRRCILKWRTGDDTHIKRIRPNRPVMLGRDAPSQLLVDHRSVSTAHCGLVFDGSSLWVIDTGSTNKIRTQEGAAGVLQLADRDVFAAGRVQFKTAIPTQLVPYAELEKLRADNVQQGIEREELLRIRSDLDRRRWELSSWVEDLRIEQDVWLRRRHDVNKEIEERLLRVEGRELAVEESLREWEQFQSKRIAELKQWETSLDIRESHLKEAIAAWETRQSTADQHWQSVADEVKRHKALVREQQVQLQRDNELSVVQRIRTQRELKEREERLDAREKGLIRREVQIEAAQRRLPRDASNPVADLVLPSDSISDSTVLSANDFGDILDRAIDRGHGAE